MIIYEILDYSDSQGNLELQYILETDGNYHIDLIENAKISERDQYGNIISTYGIYDGSHAVTKECLKIIADKIENYNSKYPGDKEMQIELIEELI